MGSWVARALRREQVHAGLGVQAELTSQDGAHFCKNQRYGYSVWPASARAVFLPLQAGRESVSDRISTVAEDT